MGSFIIIYGGFQERSDKNIFNPHYFKCVLTSIQRMFLPIYVTYAFGLRYMVSQNRPLFFLLFAKEFLHTLGSFGLMNGDLINNFGKSISY